MRLTDVDSLGAELLEILKQDQPACRIFLARRQRSRFFDESLLGEPAWDMLLLLRCAAARGIGISATVLTGASGAPPSVARRWLSVLEDEGLAVRGHSPENMFFQTVELSDAGRSRMDDYLGDVAPEA